MEKYDDNETKKRRERIATAALAGLAANANADRSGFAEEYARVAVRFADALIAELDKEPSR